MSMIKKIIQFWRASFLATTALAKPPAKSTLTSSKSLSAPCAVSGDLLHWEIDYCLGKLETDDFTGNHTAVGKCMANLNQSKAYPKDECSKKTYLKTEHCKSLMKYQKKLKIENCLKSDEFNSRTVQNGGVDN